MKNQRNKNGRKDLSDKHTINVKYLDSIIPKFNDIIADSLEDALAFAKNLDDNPNRDYVIYDKFQRIVASKIRDERKEYKHQKEEDKKEKRRYRDDDREGREHGHGHHHGHHHGNGHGHHHGHDDDDDDMYA